MRHPFVQLTGPLERPCQVLSDEYQIRKVLSHLPSDPGDILGRPQVSFLKRQREQAKREKQQMKIERRAQRASGALTDEVENDGIENDGVDSSEPGAEIAETDSPRQE